MSQSATWRTALVLALAAASAALPTAFAAQKPSPCHAAVDAAGDTFVGLARTPEAARGTLDPGDIRWVDASLSPKHLTVTVKIDRLPDEALPYGEVMQLTLRLPRDASRFIGHARASRWPAGVPRVDPGIGWGTAESAYSVDGVVSWQGTRDQVIFTYPRPALETYLAQSLDGLQVLVGASYGQGPEGLLQHDSVYDAKRPYTLGSCEARGRRA